MDKFELQEFNKRIKLNTNLENISFEICKHYNLQTQYIIKTDGYSEENQYWLNEGIIGFSFGKEEDFKTLIKNL